MIKMKALNQEKEDRVLKIFSHLNSYNKKTHDLVGITNEARLSCLSYQIFDSVRRVEFVREIGNHRFSPSFTDPNNPTFDPLKAAVVFRNAGKSDEAHWLVFLAVHFGKHAKDHWRLTKDVYGRLAVHPHWTWEHVSTDVNQFCNWLKLNANHLKNVNGPRRFSNHRKYESLVSKSGRDTRLVVRSYVAWIQSAGGLVGLVKEAHRHVGQNPHDVFEYLYNSMDSVARFGRLAKFDYLTMLDKLGLAPISPGKAFLKGATGPLAGARLLFGGKTNAALGAEYLELKLRNLDDVLKVGKQVLEDSLCNWQKSPEQYVYFTG